MKIILFLFTDFISRIKSKDNDQALFSAKKTVRNGFCAYSGYAISGLLFLCLMSLLASAPVYSQWQKSNGPSGAQINALVASTNLLFAGTRNGVYRSTDNGNSWVAANAGLTNTDVYALAFSNADLYATTNGGGIFKSVNNGGSWAPTGNNLPGVVYNVAVLGSNLFAGTNRGAYKSVNNGASWIAASTGITSPEVFCFTGDGNTVFAGTKQGVYRSINGGSSWTAVTNGLPVYPVYSMVVKGTTVFAGTWGGGVYKSENNGASWSAFGSGLPNLYVRTFIVSPDAMYVSMAGAGVYKSTNDGASWKIADTGFNNKDVFSLALNNNSLYAGTGTEGVWTSLQQSTAPVVLSFSPENKATNVNPETIESLVITFDRPMFEEKVKGGEKKISIRKNRESSSIQEINANTKNVVASGNKVIITLKQPLPAAAFISVHIPRGLFVDADKNEYSGIADNNFTTWSFTTLEKDTKPPVISSVVPAKGSQNVSPKTTLTITFNEKVSKGQGNILINQGNTTLQRIPVNSPAVSLSADGLTATVTPTVLPETATLHVLLEAGTFKDAENNAFAGLTDTTFWTFTTKDEKAPEITSLTPSKGQANVATDTPLEITFNEEIVKGQGRILISYGTSTNTQILPITDSRISISSNKVTIRPDVLPSNTLITIGIEPGAFKDKANNPHKGITTAEWSFTTSPPKDQDPPQVSAYSPSPNATGVAANTTLQLTFDEAVKATGKKIRIFQNSTLLEEIFANSSQVSIADKQVQIKPSKNFSEAAQIYITIEEGAFTDQAGNPFAGIVNNSTWKFTTVGPTDTTAPVVNNYEPENGAANVNPDANLQLVFSEEITPGEGNITIMQGKSSQKINAKGPEVSIRGNTVTINPAQNFPSAAVVHILIEEGAFKDKAGNSYKGISNATTWAFTVKDNTPLLATNYSPANASAVKTDTNLEITFNKPVIRGTGDIRIYTGNTTQPIPVTNEAIVSIAGNKVTINPPADLPHQTQVYIQITEGAFRDAAGNRYAGITDQTTWQFTTAKPEDTTPPTVTALSPAKGTPDVAVTTKLAITFNEKVEKGSGEIDLRYNNQEIKINIGSTLVTVMENIVTITLSAALPFSTTLSVLIPANGFKDLAGNAFAGITDPAAWTFTTGEAPDTTPPSILSFTPAKNAVNVSRKSKLELRFDEPVSKGTGLIRIAQGNTHQDINVESAAVIVEDAKAIISPPQPLASKAKVQITIEKGAFQDKAGNPFQGLGNEAAWTFSVEDETGPLITSLSPVDNANNVPLEANLEITFDEAVEAGKGQITIQTKGKGKKIAVNSNAVLVASNKVTINPNQNFPPGSNVAVLIEEGAFVNKGGKPFKGLSDPTSWNFQTLGTSDEQAPAVTTYSPPPGATAVEPNANLVLTFNEPIQAGQGNITITQGTTTRTIPIGDSQVSIANSVLTINPSADLEPGVQATVQMPRGIVTDLSENDFAGITGNTWSFTIKTVTPVDETGPKIATLTPTDGATDIAPDADLLITFDEAVKATDKKIRIYQNNTQLEEIPANQTTQVTITEKQVRINPGNTFVQGAAVHVTIEAGAFTDQADNVFAGITNNTTWNFTILTTTPADNTAPVISTLSPATGTVDVAATSNLRITFNEAIKKGTTGQLTLYQGTTLLQTINITDAALTIADNVLTIDPPQDLPAGVAVNVRLSSGALTDLAGNAFAGITDPATWQFTTKAADQPAPQVTALSPANNATNVGVNTNLTITFTEEVKKGTGNIILTVNNEKQTIAVTAEIVTVTGNTVTINPTEDFPGGAVVAVLIEPGTFTSLGGKAYAGNNNDWLFTVASNEDKIAPTVTAYSPADNATDVATDAVLTLTFSEEIKKGTGTILINQGNSTQTVDVTSDFVRINGNSATITPPENFPSGSAINILMLSGVFTDLANNSYAGISDDSTWNFTVPDNTLPTLTSVYPADNTTDVAPNVNLVMIFDEKIQKGTGNITITQGNTVVQQIAISSAAVVVDNTTVIINPPDDFPAGATISIQLPAGSFTDVAGNAFAGITDPEYWNLTISGASDTTRPVITERTPADGATDVAPTTTLTFVFDENVTKSSGNITINQGASIQVIDVKNEAVTTEGNTVTITLPEALPAGAAVYVLIEEGAFADLANNPFAGITKAEEWNFQVANPTPADTTPPAVATYSPPDNATNVQANTDLVVTFNEPIKKGKGTITLKLGSNNRQINVESNAVKINGTQVTINPATDLPLGSEVQVLIESGAFEDLAGNAYAGINNPDTWNFTVVHSSEDTTPPTVASLSPENNATDVMINTNLVITFSEPVKKGEGQITLSYGEKGQTINISSAAVTIQGNTLTINPPADFPAQTKISVLIPGSAVTDVSGNAFAGITTPAQWSFTTKPADQPADNTAPKATTFTPADKSQNIEATANLEIIFTEPVKAGTGTITLRIGNTAQQIAVNSPAVVIEGSKVTINPPADFAAGATVNVEIPEGAITDLAGNAFEGTDATTWSFTIKAAGEPADKVAPAIVSLSPATGTADVAATSTLRITFNEAIKKGTTGQLTLYQGTTLLQTINITDAALTIADNVLTIDPPQDLPAGVAVNVRLSSGALTDLAGNAFAGITDPATWQFTTKAADQLADNTAPLLSSVQPSNGAINVAAGENLVLTFNEKVSRKTGNISLKINNVVQTIAITDAAQVNVAGNVVTINPAADFPAGAQVSVEIPSGVITDEAGNPFKGIAAGSWSFTVATEADTAPPTVTLLSPADNAVNVPVNANLSITFSEPVKKGTGSISLFQNGFTRQISLLDQAVTVNGNTATIAIEGGFLPGATVYVLLPAGTFTDLAGNAYAGITDATSWNFTIANTSDFSKPVVSSFAPPDNSTGVAADVNLVMTFNKPVVKGQGNIIITHGTSSQTIDVNSAAVSVQDQTVTINPPADFPSESYVSVLVMPGVFKDLANNAFEGILDAGIWNFTIKDTKAPALVSLYPADNATNIPANINLVLSFDETIVKGNGQITLTFGSATQTIDIRSDAVIVSGSTVIINPPADFPHNSQVSIEIPSGAFTDVSGNPFAGLSGSSAWNLAISAFSDTAPPVAVSFSPADNTMLVQANSNLEIVFSENVTKGTGTLTINQGETSQTIDINSANVLFNGSTVIINPPADFPFGADVHVLIQEGAIKDLANNPYAGISDASSWNFTIDAAIPVEIVSQNFPEVILSSAANVEASIEVNRVPEGTKVELVSKGIASADWNRQTLTSATVRFPATLAQSQFDEIGLEYYFDITLSSGIKIASDTGYTYIQYVGDGLDIPDLQAGATVDAYQIISIPLDLNNKGISAVLEDNLNEYNIKKWRFFHYRNGLLSEYLNGLSTIETGNGYWLISRNPANINTGEGTTVKVRSSNPYVMRLRKGWNQIGNPYNFNVSWNDVKAYNNLPAGLGNLRVFESEYLDSDILRRFRGAFVFAEQDMVIQIPVLKNKTANGRISAEAETTFNPNSLWEINFSLLSKEMNYRLGGVGMHPDADFSKDRFDDITVPRFVKYLEMNFRHPEYFAPKFTKDVRPVEPNQTWDFTVESNIAAQAVTLSWQKFLSEKMDQSKQLVLYDITHDKAVNLVQAENYVFHQDSLTQFKLFYGTPAYIQENLQAYQTVLTGNYPNPFREQTTIGFRLSAAAKSYQVRLMVYDLKGQLIQTLQEGTLEAGTHEMSWDGTNWDGRKMPAGVYLYKLEAISENNSHVFTQKLIIQ